VVHNGLCHDGDGDITGAS